MFVEKDESYLQFYEPVEIKRKNSTHSWTTNDTNCDDDFMEFDDEHPRKEAVR